MGKLKQIAYDHKSLSNMLGSSQTDNIGLWLQMYGVSSTHCNSTRSQWTRIGRIDHEKKVAVNSLTREFFAGACLNIDNDIVVGMKKFNNCYARISFGSLKAGHAVAVWLGKSNGDACFFDPNYGEFWFKNKAVFSLDTIKPNTKVGLYILQITGKCYLAPKEFNQ